MTLTLWCPKNSYGRLKSIAGGLTLPCDVAAKAVDPKGPLPLMPEGVLLLMGGALADNVKALGLAKKNATVASMRERAFAYGESETCAPTQLMVTYDPAVTEQSSERLVDLLWDVQLAARLAATGTLSPPLGHYQWVDNFDEIEWRTANGEAGRLSLDLETLGLDPFDPAGRILTVALTDAEGRSAVYRVPPKGRPPKALLAQLARLLCGETRIQGANLKYDLLWLAVHWAIRGVNQTFDTHLVGSLLDENRSNSLETHAKIYTPMGGYDTEFNRAHDKGRMDLALEADPDGFLTYAGGDTDACHRVAKVQRRLLTLDKRLTRFYTRILQPASRVFAKIEERGVVVDRERYKELEAQCRKEQAEHAEAAFKLMPRRLILKYADNLSLTRPELIREFMFTKRGLDLEPEIFTEKGSKPATSAEHLNRFADHPVAGPFVRAMEKYNATTKTLSTYIVGFQRFIRADGRFHPTYRLGRGSSSDDPEGGTVTGRLSATEPAYQTIPKRTAWAKPLRSVYPCPPGHGIAKLDFNQGELRIMACLADDPTMIDAYRHNKDLHTLTAAATMGLTVEQFVSTLDEWVREEKRRAAKAINFGLLYGMMPPGLVDYARKSYGVEMSLQQAEHYWQTFFATYARLPKYHARMKKLAHAEGQVRNPLGRIRHLPLIHANDQATRSLAERQAINSPIQSALSDLMLLAMVQLDARFPDLWIFGMTHDSVEIYVPLDKGPELVAMAKETLENLPVEQFGWHPQITFRADPEYTDHGTLADVKKVA